MFRNYILLCLLAVFSCAWAGVDTANMQKQKVNWRISDRQIKAIYYPHDSNLPTLEHRGRRKPVELRPKTTLPNENTKSLMSEQLTESAVLTNVIDSPPINGSVAYVTVAVTNASAGLYDMDAYPQSSVTGSYLTATPESDYAVGIFDTGASAHIINVFDAYIMGIYDADFVTSFTSTLIGATHNIEALVSQPLGIFTDGLDAIDADTLLADDANMAGQSNVAVIIGDITESSNLPTVVGSPLAFFYTTVIENSKQLSRTVNDTVYTGPDVSLYQHDSPDVPNYPNKIVLELRPSSAYSVQYFPCFEALGETCPEGDGEPTTPSVVFGSLFDIPQSLFFATRTDLANGNRTSQQNNFMFDTGAQITVISESLAAELELYQASPDFYVEITDVTGSTTLADGYYIDLLEITATPQWLSFNNVPVVVLDVTSPEGGVLDGIIGMNLFADMDFYVRGGGLYSQDQPYIKFAFLPAGITGDIAPAGGDGSVDLLDLAALAQAWLATPLSTNWNSQADMFSDAVINFHDLAEFANYWQQTNTP